MFNLLEQKIEKYLIPVKKDRHYPRNKDKKNKYSINKKIILIIYLIISLLVLG